MNNLNCFHYHLFYEVTSQTYLPLLDNSLSLLFHQSFSPLLNELNQTVYLNLQFYCSGLSI